MKTIFNFTLILIIIIISLFLLRECGSQIYLATENKNFEKLREKTRLKCEKTPLHCAIKISDKQLFNKHIEDGIDLELKDDWGRTALHWAADNNYIYYTAELIMLGANINTINTAGIPAIVSVSGKKHLEIVRLLVTCGADINQINDWPGKSTALHNAVRTKNYDLVELLLKNGASLSEKDSYGYTPLVAAQKQNPIDSTVIIELLQQYQLQ